ncbi:MAG: DUF6020 family protein [Buchananella hordeovulneris]|nr:DUF6020 family protein [Buchananella hordeovulneris]
MAETNAEGQLKKLGLTARTAVAAGVLGAVFALAWQVGMRVDRFDQAVPNVPGAMRNLVLDTALSAVVFTTGVALLLSGWNYWLDGKRSAGDGRAVIAGREEKKSVAWLQFALLWAAWLPYWFILWPGMVSIDSYNQITQAIGMREYSDHHPIAMTAVMSLLLPLLIKLTGTISGGIAVMTLMQQAVLAAILVWATTGLKELGVSARARWIVLAFYAFFPIVAWYSASIWKDVWLAAITVFATVTALRIVRRIELREPVGLGGWVAFATAIAASALIKKTGLYVIIPVGLVGAIQIWRLSRQQTSARGQGEVVWQRLVKSPLASWVLSFVVGLTGYAVVHGALMVGFDAKPGSVVEAYSLPSQQIARIVRDNRAELSSEQLSGIAHFYPGVDLAEIYKPHLADPTKGALDAQAVTEQRGQYVQLWLGLILQHPRTAANATLVGTRGYWYPDTRYFKVGAFDWYYIVNLMAGGDQDKIRATDPDAVGKQFDAESDRAVIAGFINDAAQRIPFFGWLFSTGAWVWGGLLLLAGLWTRRRREFALSAVFLAGHWAMCMISPVHAEARYAYPILLSLPVLAALLLGVNRPCTYNRADSRGADAAETN